MEIIFFILFNSCNSLNTSLLYAGSFISKRIQFGDFVLHVSKSSVKLLYFTLL